jgi:hypothetical protein
MCRRNNGMVIYATDSVDGKKYIVKEQLTYHIRKNK